MKFDEKWVIDRFLKAVEMGMNNHLASDYAGIAEKTFYDWKKKGKADPKGPHGEFLRKVRMAKAENAAKHFGTINKASEDGDWKAAAHALKISHGIGDTQKVQIAAEVELRRPLDVSKLTSEQLDTLADGRDLDDPEVLTE